MEVKSSLNGQDYGDCARCFKKRGGLGSRRERRKREFFPAPIIKYNTFLGKIAIRKTLILPAEKADLNWVNCRH